MAPSNCAGIGPDAASDYETLRRQILEPTVGYTADTGLTLLMCRGMAAWATCRATTIPDLSSPPAIRADELYSGDAAQTQLTTLLVSMLIGSIEHKEAIIS
ncbi:MAG: hypothetical protein ACR2RB_23350 [Gammaproteobacteria bacterium]